MKQIYQIFICNILILFITAVVLHAQPQYDLRFVHQLTNCLTEEIFIDIEVKATTPASGFGIGIQNYRFNFNLTTVPAISPPIGSGNPPDRSVYISQELTISGFVASSSYSPHTLTGSSGNLVSYNVNLQGGPGYPITFDTWVSVGRLRMNLADPMPPCLNLTWNGANTLILTGAFQQAFPGTLSNLTICGICQNLPIELTRFEAIKKNDCEVLLEWETLSEINSSHFLIEKSLDGETFESVGRVQAAGTSAAAHQYMYKDFAGKGISYYRLRQVDIDGSTSVSEIIAVESSCFDDADDGFISVYPNPVNENGQVRIKLNSTVNDSGVLSISDANGRNLIQENIDVIEGGNLVDFDIRDLPAGIYFLRVVLTDGAQRIGKLVVAY